MMAGTVPSFAQELKPILQQERITAAGQLLALHVPRSEPTAMSAIPADITVSGRVADEKGRRIAGRECGGKRQYAGRNHRWLG